MSSGTGKALEDLPMDKLIATPLVAACRAQEKLANNTIQFIKTVCLRAKSSQSGDQLQKDLMDAYTKPSFDGENVTWETVNIDFRYKSNNIERYISVPLIAIVQIPNIFVSDVKINFEMEINTSTEQKEQNSSSFNFQSSQSYGWWFFKGSAQQSGKLSSYREKTSTTNTKAKYSFLVKADDQGGKQADDALAKIFDKICGDTNGPQVKTS